MNSIATTSAEQAQQDIADEFAFFGDWTERYQYLIDLGKQLPAFPDACKTEEYRVHGCQSMVWLVPSGDASSMHFEATSDSAIVSGLIALVLRVYSDRPAQEIVATEPTVHRHDRSGQAPFTHALERAGRHAGQAQGLRGAGAGMSARHPLCFDGQSTKAKPRTQRGFVVLPIALRSQSPICFCRCSRRSWASSDKVAIGRASSRSTPISSSVSSQKP